MRRPVILLGALLLAILALMAAKSWLVQTPPLRAQSAPGSFDAHRAKSRLAVILGDQRPHPADTAADDLVRERLVATLKQIGLKPVVRDQLACNELYKQRGVSCARVRNVIALMGPATGKAVLLNAHYDSTPVGPGAADDGIGVATLLEVASILKDQPLRRPVILLFNEGEELGLIGARAFLSDPLSRNVDSLVNLEARGVRGPVNMFETSRPNAAPIAVFSSTVKRPFANSLSTDVYRLLPNYTDVNSFSERGWLTLNLAPIGNETRYHSPGDDIAALDPATLQHMGDQTLALTKALANGEQRAASGDRIFMDLAGRTLVSLPLTAGMILLAALLVGAVGLAWSSGALARGAGVTIGSLVGSAALSWVALTAIGAVRKGTFWRAEPVWTHLAVYASVILVGVALIASLGGGGTQRQLRAGFWLTYLALGVMIAAFAPGGIIFFLFPPLVAMIAILLSRLWRPAELLGAIVAIVLLYLTWGGMLGLLEELLNDGPMWVFAPLGAFIILPILIEARPLIGALSARISTVVAAVLTLVFWAGAIAVPAYSADRQQRFVVEHVTQGSDKAWWSVLDDGAALPKGFGTNWTHGKLPYSDRLRWIAPAARDPSIQPPNLQVPSVFRNGTERTLTLRLHTNGSEQVSLVGPEDARVRSAGVEGFVRPIDQNQAGKYSLTCFGRSCDGATLVLTIAQPKPVDFLLIGSRGTLPASATPLLAARPRFSEPQYNRDERIAFTRIRL